MTQWTQSSDTPPPIRLIILAIQHVLVMYPGAVAVPLILGAALKLPRDQIALLINADLFACGIATFFQAFGVGPVGCILASGDYEVRRSNVFIVAISIGFGMIPLVAPTLFKSPPHMMKTMLDSGILLASVTAVALNAFFNPDQLTAGAHDAPLVVADHA